MNPKKRKSRSSRKKGPGMDVCIGGHQMYIDVSNGANGTKLFSAVNYQYVSPDSFGTQIAEHADRFNMYRFRRLIFEYKPANYNVTTTIGSASSADSNLFCFGFEADPVLTFTVTFGSVAQLRNAIQVPCTGYRNAAQNKLSVRLPSKWYYTKDDLSDNASSRQTVTGILYGEARTSITNSYNWGEIKVYYLVEFKDPCPTQGVTVSAIAREYRLGKTTALRQLLHAVKCLMLNDDIDCSAREKFLAGLSNEDYCFVTGHGRVPPRIETRPNYEELVGLTRSLENVVNQTKTDLLSAPGVSQLRMEFADDFEVLPEGTREKECLRDNLELVPNVEVACKCACKS